MLHDEAIRSFENDGFLKVENFYETELIDELRREIFELIGIVCKDNGISRDSNHYDAATFDDGYAALAAADRSLGGLIYDAVKQLSAFQRIIAHHKNPELFGQLRRGALPGLASGGSGIRIDNPGDTTFRSPWHQEYPTQYRSLDGIVFWTPLRSVTADLGPMDLAVGSHKRGIIPVRHDAGLPEQSGAYAIRLADQSVVDQFDQVSPLSEPGDLLVLDFLTLHRSGVNVSSNSRWSVQTRWFNFAEEFGRKHHWAGPSAPVASIAAIHPTMFADNETE
jgi:hypothetical protein